VVVFWPFVATARTRERPCASLKVAPTWAPLVAFALTRMGCLPSLSLSSTPGLPTYLQTKTLASGAADAELAAATPPRRAMGMATVRATVRVIRDIDVPFLFDECVRCRVRAGSKGSR